MTTKKTDNKEFTENKENMAEHNGSAAGTPCEDSLTGDGQQDTDNGDNMAETTDEASAWKDKYMRLSAEFDNYRKRTLREKMDLIASGGEDIIKVLLPVLDDMDRALEAMGKTDDIDSVRTGIELISNKLRDTLAGKGVSEVEALGLPLDTDLHEAVAKVPAGESDKGKIVEVVQKGYKLKDKVVRHAKVVVGE